MRGGGRGGRVRQSCGASECCGRTVVESVHAAAVEVAVLGGGALHCAALRTAADRGRRRGEALLRGRSGRLRGRGGGRRRGLGEGGGGRGDHLRDREEAVSAGVRLGSRSGASDRRGGGGGGSGRRVRGDGAQQQQRATLPVLRRLPLRLQGDEGVRQRDGQPEAEAQQPDAEVNEDERPLLRVVAVGHEGHAEGVVYHHAHHQQHPSRHLQRVEGRSEAAVRPQPGG